MINDLHNFWFLNYFILKKNSNKYWYLIYIEDQDSFDVRKSVIACYEKQMTDF